MVGSGKMRMRGHTGMTLMETCVVLGIVLTCSALFVGSALEMLKAVRELLSRVGQVGVR